MSLTFSFPSSLFPLRPTGSIDLDSAGCFENRRVWFKASYGRLRASRPASSVSASRRIDSERYISTSLDREIAADFVSSSAGRELECVVAHGHRRTLNVARARRPYSSYHA